MEQYGVGIPQHAVHSVHPMSVGRFTPTVHEMTLRYGLHVLSRRARSAPNSPSEPASNQDAITGSAGVGTGSSSSSGSSAEVGVAPAMRSSAELGLCRAPDYAEFARRPA